MSNHLFVLTNRVFLTYEATMLAPMSSTNYNRTYLVNCTERVLAASEDANRVLSIQELVSTREELSSPPSLQLAAA
jgi:hypothetical protein